MQQFFTEMPLQTGSVYTFTKEQAHHARDVLHMDNTRIRLVNSGRGYFARTFYDGEKLKAEVLEEDSDVNELNGSITLIMSLIRREKFELVLQKACELGVDRIIPLNTERCVVKAKAGKEEHVLQRWQSIVCSAAEQCKRNRIPEITGYQKIRDLKSAELNLVPYERAAVSSPKIKNTFHGERSVNVVIGPEGGFTEEEISLLEDMGYHTVSLGRRILRAETAAFYACSVLAELMGDKE